MSIASQSSKTKTLVADRLKADPRLAQAKQMILDVVSEHQQTLTSIRPGNPDLAGGYQKMLDDFGSVRGGNLYFPYLSSGIGNGPFVELADGSVKLDFITGIGVHGYGHSHPDLVAAGIDAAISDTVMQGNLQQDVASYEMCRLLADTACESGAELKHCFLSSSGAMANENSLKIAFQHNQPAERVMAFEHCFAGRTLALAALTDKAAYRKGIPSTMSVDYLPFFETEDPAGSTARTLSRMQEHLDRHPGKYAALWMELIQGEGGYYVGERDYFRQLCDLAHKNNMAVIADEVQSFGRTTRPFAFQHFELDKHVDIVTIGKISQVCATLYTPDYKPQPGLISQTFTSSTWAIMAGKTIVEGLIANGNFGPEGLNVQLHRKFTKGLQEIAEDIPNTIAGPFGVGGMIGMTALDGSAEKTKELVNRLFDAGLMSFMAGGNPTRLRFLLPLGSVRDEHIDLGLQVIRQVLQDMQNG
jgi:acetylornithine aminotransferase